MKSEILTSPSTNTLSEVLFARASRVIPGGVHSPTHAFGSIGGSPFVTKRGDGAYLTTVDGNRVIDFVGAWGPMIFGHNHPRIKASIIEALEHGTGFGTANPYAIQLAEKITQMLPSIEKIRMVNSGTEATMTAIRLARGYTKRNKIIKFEGCYHGHADCLLVSAGSGALTHGHPTSAGVPQAFVDHTIVAPYNDVHMLEKIFHANRNEIACLIIEAYPGNCGLLLPNPGYLKFLRDICTQHGTLLILDEVMTGFRVSINCVQGLHNITPDITCLGKIIGGGLPIGAFGGKAEIMNYLSPLGPVYQAGTMSGNPLAMAAGLTALNMLEEINPYPKLHDMGLCLNKAMQDAAKTKGIGLQFHQACGMFGFFFSEKPVRNFQDVMSSRSDLFKKLFRTALDNGVFLPPSPFEACFLSTAHAGEPIEQAAEVLSNGIRNL